jgi:hypothetical protein
MTFGTSSRCASPNKPLQTDAAPRRGSAPPNNRFDQTRLGANGLALTGRGRAPRLAGQARTRSAVWRT